MGILIATIVVSVVLLIALIIAGAYLSHSRENKKWWGLVGITPLALIILLCGSFCKVNANEVGIIYDDNKGVLTETVSEGFHTKSIFHHITSISTSNRIKTIKDTFSQTEDGQPVLVDTSLIYKVEKENAGKFFKVTNNIDISDEQMFTLVKQALQEETSKFDIFSLLSESIETARLQFEENLKVSLMENYHITLIKASFDDVDAGEQVEAILKQKAEAEQKIEIARKEAEAALIKAENEAEVAKKKAEITKTLAEAEAEAIKVKGQAEAESANAYITKVQGMIDNLYKTLNNLDNDDPSDDVEAVTYKECVDMILSIVFYDTWDGKLPEVLTSDSLAALIGGLITQGETEQQEQVVPAP